MGKVAKILVMFLGVVSFFVTTDVCFARRKAAEALEVADKPYYTRVNIWYEEPQRIYTTNYHAGTIIPAGTQVKIVASNSKEIKFSKHGSDTVFALVYMPKHSAKSMKELFALYFSENNEVNTGLFGKFSGKEKEGIKTGTVLPGMSKEAVIVAYGYPPAHRTPSLEEDSWVYWKNRYLNFAVTFKNNKVIEVGTGAKE